MILNLLVVKSGLQIWAVEFGGKMGKASGLHWEPKLYQDGKRPFLEKQASGGNISEKEGWRGRDPQPPADVINLLKSLNKCKTQSCSTIPFWSVCTRFKKHETN